ncbi:hypothetical protein [Paremcibacter congregatus]|uniref:hypothetical protein n=1 Tax=Paremcibacter congregatus TaxID=2043170 RepID=UPI0030EDF55C
MVIYLDSCVDYVARIKHTGSRLLYIILGIILFILSPQQVMAGLTPQTASLGMLSLHQAESLTPSLITAYKGFILPSGREIVLTADLSGVKKDDFITSMISTMEYHKRKHLFGLGVTGKIMMPVLQQNSWSLSFNGTITGAQHEVIPQDQRNRWNLEFRVGGQANFHITPALSFAVGAYQYRIINHNEFENPKRAFTRSHGGFATLQLHF